LAQAIRRWDKAALANRRAVFRSGAVTKTSEYDSADLILLADKFIKIRQGNHIGFGRNNLTI
jgi:hypothetical protein